MRAEAVSECDNSRDETALILYGTSYCHLCDEALALVREVAKPSGNQLKHLDIVDDEVIYAQYWDVIPVLVREDCGRELRWPFDAAAVRRLLRG